MERERLKGYGPFRIGQPFSFSEDMYSLLFIANLREEYKKECEKTDRTKNKAMAKHLNISCSVSKFDSSAADQEESEEEGEEEEDSLAQEEESLSSKRGESEK